MMFGREQRPSPALCRKLEDEVMRSDWRHYTGADINMHPISDLRSQKWLSLERTIIIGQAALRTESQS